MSGWRPHMYWYKIFRRYSNSGYSSSRACNVTGCCIVQIHMCWIIWIYWKRKTPFLSHVFLVQVCANFTFPFHCFVKLYRWNWLLRLAWMWGRLRHTKYGRTVPIQLETGVKIIIEVGELCSKVVRKFKELSWKVGRVEPDENSRPHPNFCPSPLCLPLTRPTEHRHKMLGILNDNYHLLFIFMHLLSFESLFCSYLGFQLFHLLKSSCIQLCCLERNIIRPATFIHVVFLW